MEKIAFEVYKMLEYPSLIMERFTNEHGWHDCQIGWPSQKTGTTAAIIQARSGCRDSFTRL